MSRQIFYLANQKTDALELSVAGWNRGGFFGSPSTSLRVAQNDSGGR